MPNPAKLANSASALKLYILLGKQGLIATDENI
jgi:hypothetical protein